MTKEQHQQNTERSVRTSTRAQRQTQAQVKEARKSGTISSLRAKLPRLSSSISHLSFGKQATNPNDSSVYLLGQEKHDFISHWAQEDQEWPKDFYKSEQKPGSDGQDENPFADAKLNSLTSTQPGDVPHEKLSDSQIGKITPGITAESDDLIQILLTYYPYDVPRDTLFRDDIYPKTLARLSGARKERLLKDLTPLITPSAEAHADYHAAANVPDLAIDSVNTTWEYARSVKTLPKPGYAAGFKRAAFSTSQGEKLHALCSQNLKLGYSYFMATKGMYFPFLTCEVARHGRIESADAANLTNMNVALRAVVELFAMVNRAGDLDREILAYSVSHDDRLVRIYGHYPIIGDNGKVTFWRRLVSEYDLVENEGEKWTAYRFVQNVYDLWVPCLWELITSAIDALDLDEILRTAQVSEAVLGQQSSSGSSSSYLIS